MTDKPPADWERRLAEQRERRTSWEGRRYELCRHADDMRAAIEAMDVDEAVKREAVNLVTLALRLACAIDGHPLSPQTLPAH